MTTTLDDLKSRLEQPEQLHPWVQPRSVGGVERAMEFEAAKRSWFGDQSPVDLTTFAIEVIPDYLDLCLSRARFEGTRAASGAEVLDAVVWLASNLGSSYAVGTLAVWRDLIVEVELQAALDPVLSAIRQASEPFVRDILRSLVWDFFPIGGAWPGWRERLFQQVDLATLESLEALAAKGYETIDNADARRISDGTSRFPK